MIPRGDRDRRVLRVAAGREGVRLLAGDHVEARHRQVGAGRQLADDLVEPRRLRLGDRLGAGALQRDLVAEPVGDEVDHQGDDEEAARAALRPPIASADHDQQAAERGHQDRRPEAGGEVGSAVVVIAGAASWGIERSSNVGTPLARCHGAGPYSAMGSVPRLGDAACRGVATEVARWTPHGRPGPILTGEMRRKNLLTQVLAANLLLIGRRGGRRERSPATPSSTSADGPELALVLGLAVALTILVNVIMLQRRFRPLERLIDEMEQRRPLAARAPTCAGSIDGRRRARGGGQRFELAFRRMLERLEAERRRTSSAALPPRRRSAPGSRATSTTRSTSR